MIALASVVLVITPISWILLHQPQNDEADASLPIVTRTDDTYITPTTKPAVATPTAPVTTPTATPPATPTATPSATPSATPTTTPTTSPTESPTDSTSPTQAPTSTSTSAPTTTRPTTVPTSPGRTINTPTPTPPPPPPTTTPPPPARDGGMSSDELQLFDMIDSARKNNGCAPLEQDPSLTTSARGTAGSRAKTGSGMDDSSGSQVGAGGDKMSAQQAYNDLMEDSRGTVLNCGLKTLGVGLGTTDRCTVPIIIGCLSWTKRNVWVANFS